MKHSQLSTFSLSLLGLSAAPAFAAGVMLDFGPSSIDAAYLTSSPGHATSAIPAGETSWNGISTSADRSDLVYSDGASASGVTLNLGQEATAGNGIVSYTTAITKLALTGSTGSLLSPTIAGSVYGALGGISGPGRDGIFGSGSAGAGSAIGLRVDGLTVGSYQVLVMGRNTNTFAGGLSMNMFSSAGASSETFDFSSLTGDGIANPVSQASLSAFIDGTNYASMDVSVAAGESLFIAIDGSATETRSFLNMVQIVSVPEPASTTLGALGFLVCALRRRR
jgi:hypothetical protein